MRLRTTLLASMLMVAAAGLATPLSAHAAADGGATVTSTEQLAPGVTLETFTTTSASGQMVGELVTADLNNPHVSVGLLHPSTVAQDQRVSMMANAQGAIAGINGDFFNNAETHAGVTPTGSSDGPEIADGTDLKANVPNGQRFGPGLPAGTSTNDVFGVGVDGVARMATLTLQGTVKYGPNSLQLGGLNQFAIPVGGIGAFTSDWGSTSRERAVCGTDTVRAAACSTDVEEVTVQHGVVVAEADTVGAGQIPADETVLVGREAGADALRALPIGKHFTVHYRLVSDIDVPFSFAVGGFPILRNGEPLAGLDAKTAAVRSGAGFSADGRELYLVAVQPAPAVSGGMTIAGLAALLQQFGAANGVNLDGGGSTTLAARDPGASTVTVRNTPTDSTGERLVANGIGIFSQKS
jgi:exopolysaccharide biosynthesis protein